MQPLAQTPPGVDSPQEQSEARSLLQEGQDQDFQDTDLLLDRVQQVIFGGDTDEGEPNAHVMSILKNAGSIEPVQVLAQAASIVVSRAITGMQPAPDGASAFYVLSEAIGDLATIAAQQGIFDYREEEMEAALPIAAEELNLNMGGKTFPQEEMKADASVIEGASQDWQFNRDLAMMAEEAGEPVPAGGA